MQFWNDILSELHHGESVCLMCVMQSKGSSPGRQGFKQFVSSAGNMQGSIGGGVMEQKLVDYAKVLLQESHSNPFLKHQIHQTNIEKDKSGMICSGEQTIAFYFLQHAHCSLIEEIRHAFLTVSGARLCMDTNGIYVGASSSGDFQFILKSEREWFYAERLNKRPVICIIGGGHVSLALSKCMHVLDFSVRVFDDRKQLSTMEGNVVAEKYFVNSYEEIDTSIPEREDLFVVVMTTGYRTDLIVLRKLLQRNFNYLGMLGSKEKVKRLFSELKSEGATEEQLARIHAPIGLMIHSKTPAEIAVSIAAQIIQVRNEEKSLR